MIDPEKLSNILGAETIKKIYEDGLSPTVQQVGKIGEDTLKALRLFTAPIQLLASYQDRLTKYLNKVQESIPTEKQIQAPPFLSGPIIEKIKYLDDKNYLTNMYLSLLQKSINNETVSLAHPAFYSIIEQLSPDEVQLLEFLKVQDIECDVINISFSPKNETPLRFLKEKKIVSDNTPFAALAFKKYTPMYFRHLQSLDLVSRGERKVKTINDKEEAEKYSQYRKESVSEFVTLTEFGKLFVVACCDKII